MTLIIQIINQNVVFIRFHVNFGIILRPFARSCIPVACQLMSHFGFICVTSRLLRRVEA